jgi:hypothetical protein
MKGSHEMKGVQSVGVTVLTLLSHTREAAAAACPASTTQVDTFSVEGKSWLACEDLAVPGGTLALVPTDDEDGAETVYLPKTFEPYSPEPDESYYLGLGKKTVLAAKWDMLGDAIVNQCETKTPTTGLCEPTWSRVERAVRLCTPSLFVRSHPRPALTARAIDRRHGHRCR